MMEPVRDVEPCVRLASWSCRPCSRAALIGVVRPEHFHRRLLFSLSFCFHRLLDGLGGMYALLCRSK